MHLEPQVLCKVFDGEKWAGSCARVVVVVLGQDEADVVLPMPSEDLRRDSTESAPCARSSPDASPVIRPRVQHPSSSTSTHITSEKSERQDAAYIPEALRPLFPSPRESDAVVARLLAVARENDLVRVVVQLARLQVDVEREGC